jgi:hypothetical protein
MASMNKGRLKEFERAVHVILIEEWDPIGVKSHPGAEDEYDGYIGGIVRLLLGGADKVRLADHLRRLEVGSMGLSGDEQRLSRVAESLLRLSR